jgi:hypothetical protein
MNRIVTRGMGPNHLLVTRGYGTSQLHEFFVKVIRLCACIGREMNLVAKWKTNCA